MKRKKMLSAFIATLAIITISSILTTGAAAAGKEKVLFKFNGKDGEWGTGRLTFDANGNIYGATANGGNDSSGCYDYGCGTAFMMTPGKNGKWSEKRLHSFGVNDGSPTGGLVMDAAGNLYGMTCPLTTGGSGTVYELSPQADGKWTETVVHTFNGNDGACPSEDLISDAAGNLYGTTEYGGAVKCVDGSGNAIGCGVVFELSPGTNGKWTEKVLHFFDGTDGFNSRASLTFDGAGNLYGTTLSGGTGKCTNGNGNVVGCGTVFRLTPDGKGSWKETVLYSFQYNGTDGLDPTGRVALDTSGNLYGTTYLGGPYIYGTVFKLAPGRSGKWSMTVLQSFDGGDDGAQPWYGPLVGATGEIYGSTCYGGGWDMGTIFELTAGKNGKWTEDVLFSFSGQDGRIPAELISDQAGNLYGTTMVGGNPNDCLNDGGCGVVFEFTP